MIKNRVALIIGLGLIAIIIAAIFTLRPDSPDHLQQSSQPEVVTFTVLSTPTLGPTQGASKPPHLNHGIQVDPHGGTQANIEHIKTLGLKWVELQLPWKEIESEQGMYDWRFWDKIIEAYADNNINLMLSIAKAPDWARPVDDDKSVEGLPANPASYAGFVTKVAGRYPDQVQAIEIWHWQNLWSEIGGRGRMDAVRYVQLLQQAYQAIKATNQDLVVVSGAMTPAGNVGDLATDDIDFLNQMYDHGLKGYFDALGANPSGYNCPALADWRTVTAAEAEADPSHGTFRNRHHSWCFLGTMTAYREVMLANSDGDKPIWVINFGWAVSDHFEPGHEFVRDNRPEEQARWIVEAYQWADRQAWVGPMFLSNLDYGITSPDSWLAPFGIIGQPAYEALTRLNVD